MSVTLDTLPAMTRNRIDYGRPGAFTTLDAGQERLADGLPESPVEICEAVQSLIIQPDDAASLPVGQERVAEKNLRRAGDIIGRLTELDPAPFHVPRAPHLRVVGTCRHFAVISCTLLRLRGIPARARCGFSTYFVPGKGLDHWIVEYWRPDERRWARIDTEILGRTVVTDPADLVPGQFLTGGEAWARYRDGSIDPDTFGVPGTTHAWGVGEIRGNAIRDLASLQKLETLPWDEWGRMAASYRGETGPDYDALMDRISVVCAKDDPDAIDDLYASEDLRVPADLIG
jgi:hypothetical protein